MDAADRVAREIVCGLPGHHPSMSGLYQHEIRAAGDIAARLRPLLVRVEGVIHSPFWRNSDGSVAELKCVTLLRAALDELTNNAAAGQPAGGGGEGPVAPGSAMPPPPPPAAALSEGTDDRQS
jgi:hypothetical protein